MRRSHLCTEVNIFTFCLLTELGWVWIKINRKQHENNYTDKSYRINSLISHCRVRNYRVKRKYTAEIAVWVVCLFYEGIFSTCLID